MGTDRVSFLNTITLIEWKDGVRFTNVLYFPLSNASRTSLNHFRLFHERLNTKKLCLN